MLLFAKFDKVVPANKIVLASQTWTFTWLVRFVLPAP